MANIDPIQNDIALVGEQDIDRHLNELFEDLEQTLSQGQPLSTELASTSLALSRIEQARTLTPKEDTDPSPLQILPEAHLESLSAAGDPLVLGSSQQSNPGQTHNSQVGNPLRLIWRDLQTASYSDRLLFGITIAAWLIILLLWALQLQTKSNPRPAPLPVATSPSKDSPPVITPQKSQPSTPATPASPAPGRPPPKQMAPVPAKVAPTQPLPVAAERIVSPVPTKISPPPRPVTVPNPSPSSLSKPAPVATTPPAHVLTGLMELGDRSVALVTIAGATRRIQVGETIDPGGWRLVKIADQKAVLQRQGEQRAIDVGQSF